MLCSLIYMIQQCYYYFKQNEASTLLCLHLNISVELCSIEFLEHGNVKRMFVIVWYYCRPTPSSGHFGPIIDKYMAVIDHIPNTWWIQQEHPFFMLYHIDIQLSHFVSFLADWIHWMERNLPQLPWELGIKHSNHDNGKKLLNLCVYSLKN